MMLTLLCHIIPDLIHVYYILALRSYGGLNDGLVFYPNRYDRLMQSCTKPIYMELLESKENSIIYLMTTHMSGEILSP